MFFLPTRRFKDGLALRKTFPLFGILLLLLPVAVRGQGIASTGTGGSSTLKGDVFFPSGRRAEGSIQVKLQSFNSGEITVMTDAKGSFTFGSLAPGNYTVVVDAGQNYEIARDSVVIESEMNPARSGGSINDTGRRYSVMITLQPKHES